MHRSRRGGIVLVAGLMLLGARARAASEPELVGPGVISTGDFEQNFSLTPDARTVFFAKARPDLGFSWILISTWRDGAWSEPRVAPFSGQFEDTDPFVTPDGRQVFFISKRPLPPATAARADFDIWVVARTEAGFGEPRHLGPSVNSSTDELYPSTTRSGTLYFASERAGGLGESDLYRAAPSGDEYGPAQNLAALNSPLSEHDAFVDPDERFVIFIVRRAPEGLGGADLFVSRREQGAFTPRRALGAPLNSPAWDWCPSVSPDGRWFYFSSSRTIAEAAAASYPQLLERIRRPGNGLGDIYRVPLASLGLP